MTEPLSDTPERAALSRRRRRTGKLLLILGPTVVAVAAAVIYWTGGRYVTTDNAYVQADKVIISTEVSGPIVAIDVAENDYVKPGDLLFEVDNRSYAIAVEQAKARLQNVLAEIRTMKAQYQQKSHELDLAQADIDFAEREFKRQATLENKQVIAKAELDDARHTLDVKLLRLKILRSEMEQILTRLEGNPDIAVDRLADYRLAEAQLEDAQLRLERTRVKAPFGGRVSKIPKVGKHVDPGSAVMSLIADSNVWIEANVKETDLTHILPGQKVDIEVDTYPDQTWHGTVESISPASGSEFSVIPAQNATGNWVKVVQRIPVRINVIAQSDAPMLRAGMSTYVRIDTGNHRELPSVIRLGLSLLGLADDAHARQDNQP